MNRKFINFLLKFAIIVAAYVVAAQYLDNQSLIYVTIGVSFTYIVYRLLSKREPLEELERYSNVPNYLRKIDKRYANNETSRLVFVAYGKVYDDASEESEKLLREINVEKLKEQEDLYHLYLQTTLRIAYEDERMEDLEEIYKIALADQAIHPNTEEIAKTMMLMTQDKHQEALKVLLEIIPKENRRHVIMELEVILAECYLELNQKEDAKAVLEFVASRKYLTKDVRKATSMLVDLN
jgi:thioredoxin-like negative regulator of GroEL